MTDNINTEKSTREKFLENRKDLLIDATITGAFSALTGTAAILYGVPLAGIASVAMGLVSVGKARDMYKLVTSRKKNAQNEYTP